MIQLPCSGGRKRTRTSRRFRGAHCFRNRSEALLGFPSQCRRQEVERRTAGVLARGSPLATLHRFPGFAVAPMAPWLDQGAVGVWRYLRTVSVVAPAFGGCPTSGLRSDNHVGLLFLMAEERGLAPRTRRTGCRPFSRRRRALARWLLRAEGGGLDPHTAGAVRVAFQASSIPDGFTFPESGRRDLNSRSPASQTGAFARLSYVLKGPV